METEILKGCVDLREAGRVGVGAFNFDVTY